MPRIRPTRARPCALGTGIAASLFAMSAQAVDAPLAADTHVSTVTPVANYGSLPTINVGAGSAGLLRFDLSTLPAAVTAAKVVKASLVLYVNRIGAAGGIDVTPAFSLWGEGTVTGATAPVLGAPIASGIPVSVANQFVNVDVTALVKQWVTSPGANFGLALSPALSAPGTVVFFDSKENTATGHVARLDVTLADQGPAGAQGQTGAAGATGAVGPKGDPGAQGARGDTGPAGLTGATGAAGATGTTGLPGAKGDSGSAGIQGPRGNTGLTGAAGTAGPVNLTYVRKVFDAAGKHIHDQNVQCPANTFLLSGGCGHRDFNTAASDIKIEYSGPHDSGPRIAWRCIMENTNTATRALLMYAVCSSATTATGP